MKIKKNVIKQMILKKITIKKVISKNMNVKKISQRIKKLSSLKLDKLIIIYQILLKKHNYFFNLATKTYINSLKQIPLLAKIQKFRSKITPARRIVLEYRRYIRKIKQNNRKIFNRNKKMALKNKMLKLRNKKFIYMRKHIKFPKRLVEAIPSKSNYVKEPEFVLPWILQGRKQHKQLKQTLLCLLYQLGYNKYSDKIGFLTRKQKKLVKQFRKKKNLVYLVDMVFIVNLTINL